MQAKYTNGATHPLKKWRKSHKISLAEFAGRIGRTAASVSRYEAGLVDPPLKTVQAIERETAGRVKAKHFYPAEKGRAA